MRILELTKNECVEVLTRLRFGRLGCARDNQPYIVPFNFAYHDQHLYSVTALGQKIEWMRANPLVCVEADEIIDRDHWSSVVVQGRYEELQDSPESSAERELAYALLQRRPTWWEPAVVRTTAPRGEAEPVIWMYYRIHIDRVTGRRATPDPGEGARPERAIPSRGKRWLERLVRRTPRAGARRSRA